MEGNFARSLALVLKHEGGFVDDLVDPGGATNEGDTLATFRRYLNPGATVKDLKQITAAQVAWIYRQQYWEKIRGDELPSGVDYAVFDFAVNSGPERAAKFLQGILGVAKDGQIGPQTIKAAHQTNAVQVINSLCDQRLTFLRSLGIWSSFGRGWARRVKDVRNTALKMVRTRGVLGPMKPVRG
ncbi:hypothetical protein DUT91_23610 [Phyllobacterium salinisoli]|uniref:Uncharacterized protein n=2 Tax=Phyllobacterium salinisoli TaxID=1899321 RepID=A0A368JWG4_9HYPH|nr:hypothetical protein DUT91_23610 [Phyllobacterium salinisoli]